jgi:hypothetical protein
METINIELDSDKMTEGEIATAMLALRAAFQMISRRAEPKLPNPTNSDWRKMRERIWDLRTDVDPVEKINLMLFGEEQ